VGSPAWRTPQTVSLAKLGPVRALVSRDFDRRAFERRFLAGEIDVCEEIIASRPSPAAVLASARLTLAVKSEQFHAALPPLWNFKGSRREMIERDSILATALAFAGETSSAMRLGDAVLQALDQTDPLTCDTLRGIAYAAFVHGDKALYADVAQRLIRTGGAAYAYAGLSVLAVDQGVALQQSVEYLDQALGAKDASAGDRLWRARLIVQLLTLLREFPASEVHERARFSYHMMPWTGGVADSHFHATLLLAWMDALDGNELSALRLTKLAVSIAPTASFKILARAELAFFTHVFGGRARALQLARDLLDDIRRFPWPDRGVDSRIQFTMLSDAADSRSALLRLAEVMADEEPAAALRCIAEFNQLSSDAVRLNLSAVDDNAFKALRSFTTGYVHARVGNGEAAHRYLIRAWEGFKRWDLRFRAARCALALAELTGDGQWLVVAHDEIRDWPRSWLARDIHDRLTASSATPSRLAFNVETLVRRPFTLAR